jgi:hypothetical protein
MATLLTASLKSSVVAFENHLLEFLSHDILLLPGPLFPSTIFQCKFTKTLLPKYYKLNAPRTPTLILIKICKNLPGDIPNNFPNFHDDWMYGF